MATAKKMRHKVKMTFWPALIAALIPLAQILLIDLSLAGDNAIAVGLAAAGLPERDRHRAVIAGIAAATVLRILFAGFAVQLLRITGLLAAGGLLLLWVAWKMWRDVRHAERVQQSAVIAQDVYQVAAPKKLSAAITQIVIADVSMSLDNVLAVAGVAREHIWVLVSGFGLSVLLMGAASALVARLTGRFPWIAYAGLAVVLYTALHMMWEGGRDLLLR